MDYGDHADGYVTKSGAQIRTIKAMLDTLTAGQQQRQRCPWNPADPHAATGQFDFVLAN